MSKIAYLGPEGSYTEQAVYDFIKKVGFSAIEKVAMPSIKSVIETVDGDNNLFGVVPIENSIEGVVRETVDSLYEASPKLIIVNENIIDIKHCLIGEDISKIKKIISHPQAIAQCREFISKKFPTAEIIFSSSTSKAVEIVKKAKNSETSAIASEKAAKNYGLNILAHDINDKKGNKTRFVLLSNELSATTGNDKTSIALSIKNTRGSLVELLNIFKGNDINLLYIESRPSKKTFGDYTFFIDFDGHINDSGVQKTLKEISPLISSYKFLGSYQKRN